MPRLLPAILAGGSLALASLAAPIVPTASAALVLNEVDYDQPGTDTAEFIEIKNTGPGAVNLGGYSVVLMNGATNTPYNTTTLPSVSLAAGDYYVLCGNAGNTANCDLDVTANTDWIQNGAPDAVGLVDPTGVLIDAISYEGNTGAGYTEGTGLVVGDDNVTTFIGISRFPDGADTNNNNVDWSLRCITPGSANVAQSTQCGVVPTLPATWGAIKATYR